MGQTRMFRDRVVSMEQTLEGGEKYLPLLKELVHEALPELEYREHVLDHERDLFVMEMEGQGGARKRVCWTRMMLFDAERLPTMAADPAGALRARIVEFLRSRAARPEIVVTFRHLEDGWVDTPEPKREGRRRRRGGRGGRGGGERERGPAGPERRPQPQAQQHAAGGRPQHGGRRGEGARPPQGGGRGPAPARGGSGAPAPPAQAQAQAQGGGEAAAGAAGKRRKRFRRRRRGGSGGGGGGGEGGGRPGAPGGGGAGAPTP